MVYSKRSAISFERNEIFIDRWDIEMSSERALMIDLRPLDRFWLWMWDIVRNLRFLTNY